MFLLLLKVNELNNKNKYNNYININYEFCVCLFISLYAPN